MNSRSSALWLNAFDTSLWIFYLTLLVVISFLNRPYLSESWLVFSGVFYAFTAVYTIGVFIGARYNRRALKNARFALLFCFASLIWLYLQCLISADNYLKERVFSDFSALDWFRPAATWSATPNKTRWLFLNDLFIASLFVVSLCIIDSRRRVKQLLVLIMVVGGVHALIGLAAKFGSLHLVPLSQIDGHYDAARAWFVNRNHFASFISLCLIGALTFQLKGLLSIGSARLMPYFIGQIVSLRIWILMSLVLGVLAIILSESRAGFLATVFSIVLVSMLFTGSSTYRLRKRWVLLGLAIVALTLVYFGSGLLSRFDTGMFRAGERLDQWLITWQAIKHQFFIGYGGGSYATVFQIFRGYAELRQVTYDQAHNLYLHIWLEQGLVGLALWLGFLAASLIQVFYTIQKESSKLVIALSYAGLAVVVAAMLQAWVGYNLQISNIRSYFFVIIALLFATPSIKHR